MNVPSGEPRVKSSAGRPAVPPWRSPLDAARLILQGITFRTASRVSLVVGTILSTVNQGSVITGGHANVATWVRVAVNYVVPFTVASIGYLSPFRVPKGVTPQT